MTPACSTEPAPAVAILYIATGRYICYFQEFYETAGRYFLPDCRRHIILFTDSTDPALLRNDVTVVPAEQKPWPHATLMRCYLFLEHAGLWQGYDYVFFINANYRFYRRIGQEILPGPQDGGLVAALHRVSVKRKPDRFTYERCPVHGIPFLPQAPHTLQQPQEPLLRRKAAGAHQAHGDAARRLRR